MEKPKDPHSDKLDQSPLSGDEKELEKTLVLDNYKYTKKRKIGEAIFEIINNHEVRQQCLRPEFFKDTLDLYMKTSVKSFPVNIELKPWQISILKEFEIPAERKSIWVVGKLGAI